MSTIPANLIPLTQAEKLIPVSYASLRQWASSGKLKAWRINSGWFTTVEAVAEIIKPVETPVKVKGLPRRESPRQIRRRYEDAVAELKAELNNTDGG